MIVMLGAVAARWAVARERAGEAHDDGHCAAQETEDWS